MYSGKIGTALKPEFIGVIDETYFLSAPNLIQTLICHNKYRSIDHLKLSINHFQNL